MTQEDVEDGNMKLAQIAQNKMLRVLDNSIIKDKRSKRDMLQKFDLLSVNQMAAQIKLTEAWKAMNVTNYPVKMRVERTKAPGQSRQLRASSVRDMEEGGRYKTTQASFVRDAGRLWNRAPNAIKESLTIATAKREIKKYCKTIPI